MRQILNDLIKIQILDSFFNYLTHCDSEIFRNISNTYIDTTGFGLKHTLIKYITSCKCRTSKTSRININHAGITFVNILIQVIPRFNQNSITKHKFTNESFSSFA